MKYSHIICIRIQFSKVESLEEDLMNKNLFCWILTFGDLLGNSFSIGSVKGSVSPFLYSSHLIVTLLLLASPPVSLENLTSSSMMALEVVTSPMIGPTPSLTSSQQLTAYPTQCSWRCQFKAENWLPCTIFSGSVSFLANKDWLRWKIKLSGFFSATSFRA